MNIVILSKIVSDPSSLPPGFYVRITTSIEMSDLFFSVRYGFQPTSQPQTCWFGPMELTNAIIMRPRIIAVERDRIVTSFRAMGFGDANDV